MKHYINTSGDIYAYEEDGSQDHLIGADLTAISDEDVARIGAEKEKAAFYALTYEQKRAQSYPSFADQFDRLYHGGYEGWRQQIQAVKDRYPKGQP